MKLALGTVQFGMTYGIANRTGQVSQEQIDGILDVARASGIDTIDTAIGYGDSEERLGVAGVNDFNVVSKLPPLPGDVSDVRAWVYEAIEGSLSRLGVDKLHGLMLHRSADYQGHRGAEIFAALNDLKNQARIEKLGISIYAPEELDAVLADYSIDIVQAPFNAIDQRLTRSGWLERLKQRNIEVHTRSAFLQGLLLMSQAERPRKFGKWGKAWDAWDGWLRGNNLSPLEGALCFVGAFPAIDCVVVGVDDVEQLRGIIAASGREAPDVPSLCATDDPKLIDPSNWKKL
ncbi:MAG: aldo/keto reductase [Rhodobacteraceae bacterium]|nr:aldo/keto reductase [Paracoccaceae bacterium]